MKEEIEIQQSAEAAKPDAPEMTPAQKRAAGIQRMKDLLRSTKTKGNAKDYVLATNNCHILDWERAIFVKATLPDKIDAGDHVWHLDRNSRLRTVIVVSDDGEKLLVKNDVAEFIVERGEVYPTGLPLRPTLIHKSNLYKLVGESVSSLFWNSRLKMRSSGK